jgi:hypothetical protein
MRSTLTRALRLMMALALAGCQNGIADPDAPLRFADATNGCAPTDAAAVSLTFSATALRGDDPGTPALSLRIWSGLGSLAGRSFRFDSTFSDGYGEFFTTRTSQAGPVVGTVNIVRVNADNSVTGFYRVRLKDGTQLANEFSARWRATATRCG